MLGRSSISLLSSSTACCRPAFFLPDSLSSALSSVTNSSSSVSALLALTAQWYMIWWVTFSLVISGETWFLAFFLDGDLPGSFAGDDNRSTWCILSNQGGSSRTIQCSWGCTSCFKLVSEINLSKELFGGGWFGVFHSFLSLSLSTYGSDFTRCHFSSCFLVVISVLSIKMPINKLEISWILSNLFLFCWQALHQSFGGICPTQ